MAQSESAPKIIFSMIGVSKKIERKEILRDISLSFFYGAKIGVLGLNGSGKSSLMRILAGIDKEIDGQVAFEPGYPVGFLPQEPQLTPGATVRACVEEGVAHLTALTAAYDASWDELAAAEDDATRDAISDKQAKLQEQLDALGAWDTAPMVEQAMDALRCPPPEVANAAVSRSPGCCCRNRRSCCSTSRRTISTPRACNGSSSTSRVTRARSSP
jgi:energy-dependent translational throttle protein EttA